MTSVTMSAPAMRRNQNLTRQSATLRLGPVSATFVTVALISLLALLYLNQVTKTSYFTLQRANLEANVAQIAKQKTDLEVEAGRLQSIHNVENSAVAKSMVPEGKPTYVK